MSRIHEINTATFKHCTPDGDKLIAEIARVSNPANEKNEATAPRLIRYLIEHNHWSPFQMCSMVIEVHTTREIGHWPIGKTEELTLGGDGLIELPATTIFITGPVLRRWGFHDPIHGWIDAYEWDAFCDEHGIKQAMRMDGGSDAAASTRNRHTLNPDLYRKD